MPLNHQQSYLLSRLPKYSPHIPNEPEPLKVRQAREVIHAWETKRGIQVKESEKKYNQALAQVREAIYFKPSGDALKVVKDFEEKFGLVTKS